MEGYNIYTGLITPSLLYSLHLYSTKLFYITMHKLLNTFTISLYVILLSVYIL